MITFADHIFNKHFSSYFHEEDSYKDINGEGLLERFVKVFGLEIDTLTIPSITGLGDLYNSLVIGDNLLAHLSKMMGSLPITFGYDTYYRRLVKYTIDINKLKGTVAGYQLLFSMLGVSCSINQIEPVKRYYDTGILYDTGYQYDTNCDVCSDYEITLLDPDDNCPEIGQSVLNQEYYQILMKLIQYNEPINARLVSLSYNGIFIINNAGSYSASYSESYT